MSNQTDDDQTDDDQTDDDQTDDDQTKRDFPTEPLDAARPWLLAEYPETETEYPRFEILLDSSDLADNDLEGLLDLLSETATGSLLLMDINYKVLRVRSDGMLVVEVSGDTSAIRENEEE